MFTFCIQQKCWLRIKVSFFVLNTYKFLLRAPNIDSSLIKQSMLYQLVEPNKIN
jgi:hypothetical protein